MRTNSCDVCGVQIPDSTAVEHNEAVKMPSGRFSFGAVVLYESDDLCRICGAIVVYHIRALKLAIKEDGKLPDHLVQAAELLCEQPYAERKLGFLESYLCEKSTGDEDG